jgi:hypothetical protein
MRLEMVYVIVVMCVVISSNYYFWPFSITVLEYIFSRTLDGFGEFRLIFV